MKTSRPVQILTVAFALSMLAGYVAYSQRQQTQQSRTVAPGSKSRVLDPAKQQWARAEQNGATNQRSLAVAPGSKGGIVRLDAIPHETDATTHHTGTRHSGYVASSSKSISPLIKVQPEGISWVSITGAPVATGGNSVQGADLSPFGERPTASSRSARVIPGSKSATVFTPEAILPLIHHPVLGSTNWLVPGTGLSTKSSNSVANSKSKP